MPLSDLEEDREARLALRETMLILTDPFIPLNMDTLAMFSHQADERSLSWLVFSSQPFNSYRFKTLLLRLFVRWWEDRDA